MSENIYTMVRLKKITVKKLKSLFIAEYETYDEVINRLLEANKK